MSSHSLYYSLHLLSAMAWVGGMFCIWSSLRPAIQLTLQGPQRLQLWSALLRRFFRVVWVCLILLPVTGLQLWPRGTTAGTYLHLMVGLYAVMVVIFAILSLHLEPRLRHWTTQGQWPQAARQLALMRRGMEINLLLGTLIVILAASRWPY